MADYLIRACRLQLATAIENLIRTAVLEVSQIFEDSLHDHQVELLHRREEIVNLKVKLQQAELRLGDNAVQHETYMSTAQLSESPKNSEAPPREESTVPDTVYEDVVPDDWCVPLDSDNIKQENPCPSVRLKQCSIALWPIPLKHKAFLDFPQQRLGRRDNRDKIGIQPPIKKKPGRPRVRPLEDPHKDVRVTIKQEPTIKRKPGRPKTCPQERQYKDVLKNIKQELSDSEMEAPTQTRSPSGQNYQCRFCPKVFNTQFGLTVHNRSHKKCTGCKRIFPFPSLLRQHKTRCKICKRNVKFSSQLTEKKSSRIQQNTSAENPRRRTIPIRLICKKCLRRFSSRLLFVQHSCNFVCNICSKRFTSKVNLNVHKGRMHKNSTENILEAAWTKPLGYNKEGEDNKKRERLRTSALNRTCKQCLTTCTSRSALLTHSCEIPCPICPKTFSCTSSLNRHKRKVHENPSDDKVEASRTKPLDEGEQSPENRSSSRDKEKNPKGENLVKCWICKQCLRKFVSQSELLTHTCLEFACPICSKTFSSRWNLNIHKGRIHKKRTKMHKNHSDNLLDASCTKPLDESDKNPENESSKLEKGRILRKDRSAINCWTCKKCLRNCDSRSALLTHTCLEFSCPICSKSFSCRSSLNIHKGKIHKIRVKKQRVDCKVKESWTKPLDEREKKQSKLKFKNPHIQKCDFGFKCLICKQILAAKQSALEHVYSHTGEKPYACEYCPLAFSYRSLLSLHRSAAHGMQIQGSRKCVCSRLFLYRKSFDLHVLRCPAAIAKTKEEPD